MTNILKDQMQALGGLMNKNMKESASSTLKTAELEKQHSQEALGQWEQNYNRAKANVDENIKQQNMTFTILNGLLAKMNRTTARFERGLEKWKYEQLAKAAVSFFTQVAGILGGNAPDFDDAAETVDEIAEAAKFLPALWEMIQTILDTFVSIQKHDSSSFDNLEFQPTYNFDRALQQSTYFLERANDFDEIKLTADIVLTRIDEKTDFGVDGLEDLRKLMANIAIKGERFVDQVCTYSHGKELCYNTKQVLCNSLRENDLSSHRFAQANLAGGIHRIAETYQKRVFVKNSQKLSH